MSITEQQLEASPYKKQINYFMTNFDLMNIFQGCKIVKFADLDLYKDIYELLPNKLDFVFILVETQRNHGHWQLLLRDDNYFEFFDPYGDPPNTILNFIPKYMMEILGNDYNKDIGHILKSIKRGDKLIINKYPFQSEVDDVNTCGRWVALRIILLLQRSYKNKDVIKYINGLRKQSKLKNDEVITLIVKI